MTTTPESVTPFIPLPSAEDVVAWLEREGKAAKVVWEGVTIKTVGGQGFYNCTNLKELYRQVLADGRDLTLLLKDADSTLP